MSIGLTRKELENRSNDSLIKYIGQLQRELELHYEPQLPSLKPEAASELDSTGTLELKCPA